MRSARTDHGSAGRRVRDPTHLGPWPARGLKTPGKLARVLALSADQVKFVHMETFPRDRHSAAPLMKAAFCTTAIAALLSLTHSAVHAQSVRGRVVDALTADAAPLAMVTLVRADSVHARAITAAMVNSRCLRPLPATGLYGWSWWGTTPIPKGPSMSTQRYPANSSSGYSRTRYSWRPFQSGGSGAATDSSDGVVNGTGGRILTHAIRRPAAAGSPRLRRYVPGSGSSARGLPYTGCSDVPIDQRHPRGHPQRVPRPRATTDR